MADDERKGDGKRLAAGPSASEDLGTDAGDVAERDGDPRGRGHAGLRTWVWVPEERGWDGFLEGCARRMEHTAGSLWDERRRVSAWGFCGSGQPGPTRRWGRPVRRPVY